MKLKVFQKRPARAGGGGRHEAALKPQRPFATPAPTSPQATEPQAGARRQPVAPRGHDFGGVAVRGRGSAGSAGGAAGLPDKLRTGVERLSGLSLGDVRVHYNSPATARLKTLAHTQGTHIHVAAGQERHLAHEAWHVVQQKQGRVRATTRTKAGVPVNNNAGLEREADTMGARALASGGTGRAQRAWEGGRAGRTRLNVPTHAAPVQGVWPFTDSHAPPASLGGRVQTLRDTLERAGHEQRADPQWYDAQQKNLAQVEGEAHTWFRDHGHLATEEQRRQVTNHLNALEDHHADLVGVQRAHNHPLWLPEGTSNQERGRANQVWSDVQNDAGNLTIDNGDAGFRNNTLAGLAKLLQRQHGRDTLHALNADQGGDANRRVRIGADWSGTFGQQNREHKAGSWATPLVEDTRLDRHRDDGTPNVGIGSYVQFERGQREMETGAHGTGVPMPHYLTLGHELGHALNNLSGTATHWPDNNPTFAGLSDTEKMLWSNDPEEHANITRNENAIRAQHGLPERAYHRPPKVVRATHMKNDLKERIDQVMDDFPHDQHLHQLNPYGMSFHDQKGVNEPEFYERANAYINSLYRWRNVKRAGLAIGVSGLALLGGYGIYRARR